MKHLRKENIRREKEYKERVHDERLIYHRVKENYKNEEESPQIEEHKKTKKTKTGG